ncbi:hypothetical protein SUDANB121_00067 [Nocardiopsis dassonvillei]
MSHALPAQTPNASKRKGPPPQGGGPKSRLRSDRGHPQCVPPADQSGQLSPLTRSVPVGSSGEDVRHRSSSTGSGRFHAQPLGPLALLVRDQVRTHRPYPVLVHTPARARQPHRGAPHAPLVTLGEEDERPVRVGAPSLVVAPHPLRLTIRTHGCGTRGLRGRGRRRPFRGRRISGRRGARSDDRGEHRACGAPQAVGPPSSAPAVPTRTMTHGSSSWCSQVGDHASVGAPSPSGAPSLLCSSQYSFPCSGRGGCQWPRRSFAPRSCASSPHRTR